MFDSTSDGKSSHKMNRMEINGGGIDTKSMYTFCNDVLGIRNPGFFFSDRSKKDQIIVLTATLVLVCIFVFVASEFSSSTSTPAVITPVLLGSDLRYYLHKSFSAACSEGSLAKVNVTSPPAVIEAQGIEFLVMTLRDPSFKSRIPVYSTNLPIDPFLPSQLLPSHIVSPIASRHTLILNKYYTINEHSILITNNFERQEALLTLQDIEAWFFCIASIKALGFYNSNSVAGASQPHKHMQLIPLNEIRNLSPDSTYTLPIDISIRSKIIKKEWKYFFPFSTSSITASGTQSRGSGFYGVDTRSSSTESEEDSGALYPDVLEGAGQDNVYNIPEYRFKHALVALIAAEEWEEVKESTQIVASYSDYLVAAYRQLLWELQLTSSLTSRAGVASGGYNLLLTERWMLLVCRQQEAYLAPHPSSLTGNLGFGDPQSSREGDKGAESMAASAATMDMPMQLEGEVEGEFEVASVNGLGFAGLLLARSPVAMGVIRDKSPLMVLQGVSMPMEQ